MQPKFKGLYLSETSTLQWYGAPKTVLASAFNPWVTTVIFLVAVGTETPLSSKLTVMKEQRK